MALSPSHAFGQIIGNVLENALEPFLREFANRHGLYFDRKGKRAARTGSKVTWQDANGNKHDLDFVLERGGTEDAIGTPVAFIEVAWRRYAKHSRNKAQEIQGAIVPLTQKYGHVAPFIGVVLAGEFTAGARKQLKSWGFAVLYVPYSYVQKRFARVGINAAFDEDTPDADLQARVEQWKRLSENKKSSLVASFFDGLRSDVSEFMDKLARAVSRTITLVRVLPLHGSVVDLSSIKEAIRFIEQYDGSAVSLPLAKYEVQIRFSNGDHIHGAFEDRAQAVSFLRGFEPAPDTGSVRQRRP